MSSCKIFKVLGAVIPDTLHDLASIIIKFGVAMGTTTCSALFHAKFCYYWCNVSP